MGVLGFPTCVSERRDLDREQAQRLQADCVREQGGFDVLRREPRGKPSRGVKHDGREGSVLHTQTI